jgi:hypothetical protein
MRAVSAREHIMNIIPAGVNPVALGYALRWLSRCASIIAGGEPRPTSQKEKSDGAQASG